jgi:pilus assembly protein Flp/PilA
MARNGKLLRDERGIGTIEYALVAGLISVAAISAYSNLGTKVQSNWSKTYNTITVHLG